METLLALCVLNVGVAIAIPMLTARYGQFLQVDAKTLLRWGGMHTPFVRRGQYWRLVSAMFLHANVQHVAVNTAALYVVGKLVVERLGEPMLVVIYFVTGIAGFVLTHLVRRNRLVRYDESFWRLLLVPQPLAVAVGASGAVCGLIAAVGMDAHLHGDVATRDQIVKAIGYIALYSLTPGVDKFGHLGGLLAGAAIGALGGQPGLQAPLVALVIPVILVVVFRIVYKRGADVVTVTDWSSRAADARKAKDTDAEIAAYREALAMHPRNAAASYNLSLALERKGDLAGALAQAELTATLTSGEKDAVRLRDRLAAERT